MEVFVPPILKLTLLEHWDRFATSCYLAAISLSELLSRIQLLIHVNNNINLVIYQLNILYVNI